MTEMRRRMEEELELRGHSSRTQTTYVQWVRRFAEHYHRGPERLGTPEVRAFLVHLLEQKLSRSSLVQAFCALKFFYVHVLHRPYEVEDPSFRSSPRHDSRHAGRSSLPTRTSTSNPSPPAPGAALCH